VSYQQEAYARKVSDRWNRSGGRRGLFDCVEYFQLGPVLPYGQRGQRQGTDDGGAQLARVWLCGRREHLVQSAGVEFVLRHCGLSPRSHGDHEGVYTGPKPDLLQHEAQAIAEGKLNPDGTFVASNLLLKCPTRYEDQLPTPTPASN
jgi:hypothetical protein